MNFINTQTCPQTFKSRENWRACPALDVVHMKQPKTTSTNTSYIVTSRHALPSLPDDKTTPIFSVGASTTRLLEDAGYLNIHTGVGTVADMPGLIKKHLNTPSITYLGEKSREKPAVDLFNDHDIAINYIPVYETRPNPDFPGLLQTEIEQSKDSETCILILSAKAGEAIHQAAETLLNFDFSHINALCLSQSVVKSIEAINWKSVSCPARPTRAAFEVFLQQYDKDLR